MYGGENRGGERWCRQGLRGSNDFESGVHLDLGDGGGKKALPLIRLPSPSAPKKGILNLLLKSGGAGVGLVLAK